MTKRVSSVKVEFLKFFSQVRSTSNGIISGFRSPNEEILNPKLYLRKSSFQRNKRRANILSNEEVMIILLKLGLLVKLQLNLKFARPKLTFGRPKLRK